MITDERVIEFHAFNNWDSDIRLTFNMVDKLDICDLCTSFECISHTEEEQQDLIVMMQNAVENVEDFMFKCRIDAEPLEDYSDCKRFIPNAWDMSPIEMLEEIEGLL